MADFKVTKTVLYYDKETPEGAYIIKSKKLLYYEGKRTRNPRTYCIKELTEGLKQLYAKGIALCRKDDTFNKKIGREIAEGRANKIKNWLNDNANELDDTTSDNLLELYSGLSKAEVKCMKLLASSGLSPLEKELLDSEKPGDKSIPAVPDSIPPCGTTQHGA